jgi:phosphotransferase system  glucose/maltose/N-acetylglucosamine-specific IIC component
MDIGPEMRRKIAVSVVAVGLFIVLIIGIGVTFAGQFGSAAGLALVGAIVLFIVLMAGVGVWLNSVG